MISEGLLFILSCLAGWALGMVVPTDWIGSVSRAFWRVLHRKGCPGPFLMARKELLESYQALCWGMPFDVEHFDIRLRCPRCGRTHRNETKIFTQINPYL